MRLRLAKQTIAMSLGLLLAACASIDSQDTDQYIFLDTFDLLFIDFRYTESELYDPDLPDLVDNREQDRKQHILNVIKDLFNEYQLPIKTYFLKKGEDPRFGPVLEITTLRYEQDFSGDLIATFRARLSKRGEMNTLGTYTQREIFPAGGGDHLADQAYRDVLRKPLREMMRDLIKRFPNPEEQEILNPTQTDPAAF